MSTTESVWQPQAAP